MYYLFKASDDFYVYIETLNKVDIGFLKWFLYTNFTNDKLQYIYYFEDLISLESYVGNNFLDGYSNNNFEEWYKKHK